METSSDEYATQPPVHLEPVRCAHMMKMQCWLSCTAMYTRETCAFARVQMCCLHSPSHSQPLLLTEWETQTQQLRKKIPTRTRPNVRSDFIAPVAGWLFRLLENASSRLFHSTLLWIYRPFNCAGAIFTSSKSLEKNSGLRSVNSCNKRMADVLLRNVVPYLGSAAQSTLAPRINLVVKTSHFTFSWRKCFLCPLSQISWLLFRFPVPSTQPKHPVNYGQPEIACNSYDFAICPTITWIIARLF